MSWQHLDPQDRAKWLERAAAGGSGHAWFDLGVMIYREELPDRPASELIHCFEEASKLGHHEAQVWLGDMYEKGIKGVRINRTRALELYKAAANGRYWQGMRALGNCYRDGSLVPQNAVEAYAWYTWVRRRNPGSAGSEMR